MSLAGCSAAALAAGSAFASASPAESSAPAASESPPVSTDFTIVAQYPHDTGAWTEGLTFLGDQLYETTGRLGMSSLRHVDLDTGKVLQQHDLSASDYGEGLTFLDDKAWVLTWTQQHVLLFDPQSFEQLGEYPYEIQGWGLTTDGQTLYMSDGTNRITQRSPADFRVLRWVDVAEEGKPVAQLNELEWIDGYIWANVWLTPEIVVIDPSDGHVLRRFDFSPLLQMEQAAGQPAEMNGIAWMSDQNRLFLTGKLWSHVYEISVDGLPSQ
jgi:glutamine cyclotransferase